MEVEFF